jgi:hypothetical protein
VPTVVSSTTTYDMTGETTMKTSHAILAIALTATALGGGSAIAASSSADEASAKSSDWLTIPAIYDKVVAAGYSDIHEIERERDGYEIEAVDTNGNQVELFVDPISGEVLGVRTKESKSDKDRD